METEPGPYGGLGWLTPWRCRLIFAALLAFGFFSHVRYLNRDCPIDLAGDEARDVGTSADKLAANSASQIAATADRSVAVAFRPVALIPLTNVATGGERTWISGDSESVAEM